MPTPLRIRKTGLVGLLVVFLLGATTLAMAQNCEILRADPDGTNLELILSRESALARGSIAFDPDGGNTPMYWSSVEPWSGAFSIRPTIRRAGYLGELNVPTVAWGAGPVAIDPLHDKVYYVRYSDYTPSGQIHRADLDGSDAEYLVGEYSMGGLVVDPSGGKIYWSGETLLFEPPYDYVSGIWSADLDGSQAQLLIDTGTALPGSLAIDTSAGKLYWAEHWDGRIRRANIDGSAVELVVPDASWPGTLAVDPDGDRMWWSEWSTESGQLILRAHLDGSEATPIISGLDETRGLAYVRDAGTDGEKLYIVANPGPADISVPAVSGVGAMVLVLLLALAAAVTLLRRRVSRGGSA